MNKLWPSRLDKLVFKWTLSNTWPGYSRWPVDDGESRLIGTLSINRDESCTRLFEVHGTFCKATQTDTVQPFAYFAESAINTIHITY